MIKFLKKSSQLWIFRSVHKTSTIEVLSFSGLFQKSFHSHLKKNVDSPKNIFKASPSRITTLFILFLFQKKITYKHASKFFS